MLSTSSSLQGRQSAPTTAAAAAAWLRCLRHSRPPHVPRHTLQAAVQSAALAATEQELVAAVRSLGYPQAIFPGGEASIRAGIDAAIARLEAATPTPSPLQPVSPLLLGEWHLIYASRCTRAAWPGRRTAREQGRRGLQGGCMFGRLVGFGRS